MTIDDEAPRAVLDAYGYARAERLAGGLINETYLAYAGPDDEAPAAVVQRLHPVFRADVHHDIEAVTAHLEAKGVLTPRLVRARSGALWVEHAGGVWRAQTYVRGRTIHRVGDPAEAREAGALVGRFHRAVADLEHDYVFARAGVHDTAAHLARLAQRIDEADGDHADAVALGREILAAARDLPELGPLPLRHCHGDLKISNVLFAADGPAARCLIDLDTVGLQTIAYELGDAMRSWCNPHGEDVEAPAIDRDLLDAAMAGYAAGAGDLLSADELASVVPGLETVCVELAARFCADVFDDAYFGWDPSRFPSRRAHNEARARGQLALARSVGTVLHC